MTIDVDRVSDETLSDLVSRMNAGRSSDSVYVVDALVRFSESGTPRIPRIERDYIVRRQERGKTIDIATLKFHPDGTLRTALIERGLDFYLVPKVLRLVAP